MQNGSSEERHQAHDVQSPSKSMTRWDKMVEHIMVVIFMFAILSLFMLFFLPLLKWMGFRGL